MQQTRWICRIVLAMVLLGGWTACRRHAAVAAEPSGGDAVQSDSNNAGEASTYPPGFIPEAPLPEGFPPPSEVGRVVEKSYPLCRTYSAPGNNAFMRCFAYLSKQRHEMTIPVILDYRPKPDAREAQPANMDFMDVARMHFILEEPSLDEPKEDGPVTVADMPRMRVLSIAIQGAMSAEKLGEAERKLEAEMARRKNITAAGPKRVLGYNSPMVPRDKAFWEIQVPIRERSSDPAK